MHHVRLSRALAAALAALMPFTACSRAASVAPAATSNGTTTLLVRLGVDTTAMEQYTRTPTHLEGTYVQHLPFTAVARYAVDLGAGNAPTKVEYSVRRGDGTMAPGFETQSLTFRFAKDSAYITGHRASGDTTRTVAMKGEIIPYIGGYGPFELALDRLRASGRDSATFALAILQFGMRNAVPLPFRVTGAGDARYDWFGYPVYLRHDGRAGILGVDGLASTIKVRVDRVANTDLDAQIRSWTQHEQTVGATATSTRDTVRATVGRANIWIDYGRPALRGRDVWTGGVLGDTLWRSGANAATQLHTDADLMIGGSVVPAGTYSLWTSVTPDGYHLVINKQFGQWGTVHDAARDLVRVPLRESTLPSPVERFTIAVDPRGLLQLSWGTRQLGVPVTTR